MSQDEEKKTAQVLDFQAALKRTEDAAQEEFEANDPRIQLLKTAMAGAEKGWAMVLVARSDDGVIVNTTVPLEDAFLLTFIGSDILKVAAYSNDETVH